MCEIRDILDTTISLSAMNKKLQCKGTDSISELGSTQYTKCNFDEVAQRLREFKADCYGYRNFEIFEFDVISIKWK